MNAYKFQIAAELTAHLTYDSDISKARINNIYRSSLQLLSSLNNKEIELLEEKLDNTLPKQRNFIPKNSVKLIIDFFREKRLFRKLQEDYYFVEKLKNQSHNGYNEFRREILLYSFFKNISKIKTDFEGKVSLKPISDEAINILKRAGVLRSGESIRRLSELRDIYLTYTNIKENKLETKINFPEKYSTLKERIKIIHDNSYLSDSLDKKLESLSKGRLIYDKYSRIYLYVLINNQKEKEEFLKYVEEKILRFLPPLLTDVPKEEKPKADEKEVKKEKLAKEQIEPSLTGIRINIIDAEPIEIASKKPSEEDNILKKAKKVLGEEKIREIEEYIKEAGYDLTGYYSLNYEESLDSIEPKIDILSLSDPSKLETFLSNEVVTLEAFSLAISNKLELNITESVKIANCVLDLFGYEDSILDNILSPGDRDIFYTLEEEGLLESEREELTIYDGRFWRIFSWRITPDIRRTININAALFAPKLLEEAKEKEKTPEEEYENKILRKQWSRYLEDKL